MQYNSASLTLSKIILKTSLPQHWTNSLVRKSFPYVSSISTWSFNMIFLKLFPHYLYEIAIKFKNCHLLPYDFQIYLILHEFPSFLCHFSANFCVPRRIIVFIIELFFFFFCKIVSRYTRNERNWFLFVFWEWGARHPLWIYPKFCQRFEIKILQ